MFHRATIYRFRGIAFKFTRKVSRFSKRIEKFQEKEPGPLNEYERKAFETLKEKLNSPPLLTMPKREERFTLNSDAYNGRIDKGLLQTQDNGSAR